LIQKRPTDAISLLGRDLGTQAKVNQFAIIYSVIIVENNVLWLYISVDVIVVVEVFYSFQERCHYLP